MRCIELEKCGAIAGIKLLANFGGSPADTDLIQLPHTFAALLIVEGRRYEVVHLGWTV